MSMLNITRDVLDSLIEEAHETGYDQGVQDGQDDGFECGYREGYKACESEFTDQAKELLRAAVKAPETPTPPKPHSAEPKRRGRPPKAKVDELNDDE